MKLVATFFPPGEGQRWDRPIATVWLLEGGVSWSGHDRPRVRDDEAKNFQVEVKINDSFLWSWDFV